ncbi:MAG: tRNA (adenosine(37)-N6)-threonylcarbamoyltransferase complex ATPase subunit type 1 TsaE [Lentisphaerae bacterium]|nr:tRNA (adenosine(37)-N6)-threonylcarbamoyltransferase complex ATPase subunit type 1 TsaE [Lentisphaerota bacterium]
MTHGTETWTSRSPAETRRLAARLAADLPPRAILALHGELGSGKTCFVQGLAEALHIAAPVTSPTFTLIREYQGDRALTHIDLYRLATPDEAGALDLDAYMERDGITAIEWAEKAAGLLPDDTIHITFRTGSRPRERTIALARPCG